MPDDFPINPESEAYGDYLAELGKVPAAAPVAPAPAPAIVPPQIRPQPVDKVAPLPAVVAAEAPTVRDYIADRLSKKDEELKAVQDQSAEDRKIAGVTEGVGQMIAGLSHSNQPFNPGGYQFLQDNAKQPVAEYMQRQAARGQNLQQLSAENKFQRDSTLQDPASMQSTIARRMAAQALSKYGEDPAIVNNMSASDLKEFLEKPLDQMEARDSREMIAKLKQQELALKRRELDAAAKEKRDLKTKADQDKNYKNLRHDLETFRGNTAAQTAATGVLSADKALDLVKGKDPNTLTTQDLQLLVEEMGKLASGGVPTEHGTQALMPHNLETKYAEMKNFFLSKPQNAQAGEYIKHNMQYLQEMKKTSQQVLDTYRTNIAKGYKHLVRPEDHAEALNDYHIGEAPKPGPGSIINTGGKRYRVGADGDTLEAL